MGRHRRSADAPVANDYADGSAGRHRGGARRKKRGLVPVRTGLLGASAAMAVGAVAVTTGLLPGGDKFNVGHGNDSAKQVRTEDSAKLQTQGDASAEPTHGASAPCARAPSARRRRRRLPRRRLLARAGQAGGDAFEEGEGP